MSETKDECGESSNAEHTIEMEEANNVKDKETVKLKPLDREVVSVARRVLRSGSVARDPVSSDKHKRSVKKKGKVTADKEELSKSEDMGEVSGRSFVDEVKEEVKQEDVKSSVPEEIHGDNLRLDVEDGSFEATGKEVKVKRKRGRPRKFAISSQSDVTGSISNCKLGISLDKKEELVTDDKDEKVNGESCSIEEKLEVKLVKGEYADKLRLDVEDGSFEATAKEVKVNRKRGRPRKFTISSQSDVTGSISNCKLGISLDKKEELVTDDKDEKVIGGSCSIEEKLEVKLVQGEYADKLRLDVEDGSFEATAKEVKVKRKRGRPRKFAISSQSDVTGSISNCKLGISLDKKEELVTDDKDEKVIGGSCSIEEKSEVKLVQGEYAEAKEIPGVEAKEIRGVEAQEIAGAEAKEISGVEAKEIPVVEAKEIPGVEAKEIPGVEAKEIPVVEAQEIAGAEAKEISGVEAKEIPVVEAKEIPGVEAKEIPVVEAKEIPVVEAQEIVGAEAKEISGVEAKEIPGVEAKEIHGVEAKEIPIAEAKEIPEAEALEIPGVEAKEIPGVEAKEIPVAEAIVIPGAEAKEIPGAKAKEIPGAEFGSQVKVEIKDDRSEDGKGNVEPHDEEPQVKRKWGRPRKFQISNQSDECRSNTNCKLVKTPDSSSQPIVDGICLKRKRGRPPKTKETTDGLYIKKEDINCTPGSILITPDQSVSDSIDESKRPESNCGGRAKGPQSDGGNCKGRKMSRKRGRPATTQKKKEPWEADESDGKAKKRTKLRESPLESHHSNPLTDGERRIGEQENKQNEAGRRSKSKSKKMLSDRILQLLLAAGWTVEYRPRNGKAYQDAVYLNPEGKTHWSVTKAYHVYKKDLESSMNGQMESTTGSGFGLLPEEELHLLGRKVQKKRCDKGKPKLRDGTTNENIVSTKGLGKRTLHVKRVQKGKIRMQKRLKRSHGSHNLERISSSVRKIKKEGKQKRKRCAPSARRSLEDADSKENGYIFFEGKRTMLGWMIDAAIVPLNGKVLCMDCKKTKVLLEGIITKEGIQCNCCDEVFSVLDFEVHAGGKRDQPFKSLYLEGGNSLLQCLLDTLNKPSEPQNKGFHFVDFGGGGGDPNDDTCGICGDGGDLICCDACPATFHQSCLDIKKFPSGAWFCCYCSCKFCEKVESFNHDTATLPPLLSCRLCEEKYHQVCINQDGMVPGEESTDSFCGKHCQELFEELQLLIGVKHTLPEGFSWTFLRHFELPTEISDCETSEKIAYNAKMAVAFSVMDECFSPFVDHRSGVNLLQNIVYNFGSNFLRYNFSSFLTAVLERGDEVIGVASIRIHGNQLAEMPFIGTRSMYRRQGMCRRLLSGIESALGSLNVEKLVIPAVPELVDTWTLGFGFTPINESGKKTIKNLNLLVFPGVDMLEKSVAKEKITDATVFSTNGSLPLAPEMSLPVDVEENNEPDESKDSANERNCATADVEFSSMNVEEGNDTESNLKLPNKDLEEKEEIGNLTVKDVDALPLPDEVDDSQADQTDTKRQDSGDLEDKTLLSDDDEAGGKAEVTEESDQQSDCIIIDHPQPLSNGGKEKAIDNKDLAIKREVTSTLRVSSRLMQRSWRTSRVN